jgi:hypothetical protein
MSPRIIGRGHRVGKRRGEGSGEVMADRDQVVLRSMIESYERARAEHQEFVDRIANLDPPREVRQPHRRRVRVATSAPDRQSCDPDEPGA